MSNTDASIEKVRSFFKKIHWRNILTFSFFVILASIFWVMQIYRQKFEDTFVVPIKYVNIPDNIVFDTELPKHILLRIKDDGANLVRYTLGKSRDSIEINVKQRMARQGGQVHSQSIEDIIRKSLFVSSELLSYSPTEIEYTYQTLHEKQVPVVYKGHIDLAPGYIQSDAISVLPDYVTAYGSAAALDTLEFACTANDTLFNFAGSKNLLINLELNQGVKYKPAQITMNVPVDKFRQKEVEVPVECINLPPNITIKFFPSSVTIPFFVGLEQSDKITASDFRVVVDYASFNDNGNAVSSTPIQIVKKPDYIKTKLPIPAEVEFVLELD